MNSMIGIAKWGGLLVVVLLVGWLTWGWFFLIDGPRGKFSPADIGECKIQTMDVDGQPTTIMELMADRLIYTAPDGTEWVAVKGTLTDGASIPTFALSFTGDKFSASFLKAAIVHDAYCQCFVKDRCPEQYHKRPWQAVHQMFRDACIAGGTDVRKANLLFAAVWMYGPRWNDDSRNLGDVAPAYQRILFQDCKDFIEKPPEKTERSAKEIEAWMGKRQPTILAINDLETQAMTMMRKNDMPAAAEKLLSVEKTLDEAATKFPDDLMVQNLRGYHHKNLAILFQTSNLPEQKEAELDKAETAFQKVINRKPQDASALNGMGSVSILRGELDVAKDFVDKALQIDPTYPEAKHDRALIDKIKLNNTIPAAPPQ